MWNILILNIGKLPPIVTKRQYRLTKQDPQTNADGPMPLVNHQFLISDLTHSRCSTNDDQMNCISILYMSIWSSVLSVIGFSAPPVKENPASRSSSNLSSSPLFFIRKLLTNVFSINYCNQSAATFTGQENTSTTVRRPDNHNFHLSNMPSLSITMQLHPQVQNLTNKWLPQGPLREQPCDETTMDVDPTENSMVPQPLKTMPHNRIIKTDTEILQEQLSCFGHKRAYTASYIQYRRHLSFMTLLNTVVSKHLPGWSALGPSVSWKTRWRREQENGDLLFVYFGLYSSSDRISRGTIWWLLNIYIMPSVYSGPHES